MKKLILSLVSLLALLLVACDSGGQAVPSAVQITPTAGTGLSATTAPTDTTAEVTTTMPPTAIPTGTADTQSNTPTIVAPETATTSQPMQATSTSVSVVVPSSAPTLANTPTAVPSVTESNVSGGIVIPVGIDYPANNAQVTLPLHVQVHLSKHPGDVVVRLRWADGQELSQKYTPLADQFGHDWVVDSLDWTGEGPPPAWKSGPATLQVLDAASNSVLVTKSVTYLSSGDPGTMQVKLYWYAGNNLQQVTRTITRTQQVASAAVSELLWGIGPRNFAGFTSAIPSPAEVLAYKGRTAEWGPRVTLRKLTVTNGIANVDLSREAQAFGGAKEVGQITDQITATLKQFSAVTQVNITVEGSKDVLQP